MGTRPEIVGREPELATLRAFVAGDDPWPALLLSGGAGIGKTTLWKAGVEEARARGARVLSASPSETEAKLSLAGLADLLEPIEPDVLAALPDPQRRALEVVLLRAEPGNRPPERRAVAAAFRGVLRELSGSGPVVVAIDDVQWLDPSSGEVVAFAARRLDRGEVRLLLTERTGDPSAAVHTVSRAEMRRLALDGLSLGATRRLLSERLDLRLPRRVLHRLHETTGGNPLFALEVGGVLAERGLPPADEPLPVPSDVRTLVGRRVAALPEPTKELLLAAALLAQPNGETLRSVLGRPVESDLEPAERAGVAALDHGAVAFSHPLHAAAVVASATVAELRRMHRRLAEAVEVLEERARHLALAVEGRDEAAARAIHGAAREAFLRGAATAAAELVELALEVGDHESADRPQRALEFATYVHWIGDPARARSILEEVHDWRSWSPVLQARACAQRVAAVYWTEGAVAATEVGERMLAEPLPAEARAMVHAALGDYCEADVERAARHSAAALALLATLGDDADPGALARALTFAARNRLLLGEGLDRDAVTRVLALEERLPPERWATERVSRAFGSWFKHVDDLDTSREWLERGLREAEELEDELAQLTFLMHLGLTECWAGNLQLARERLRAANRLVEELSTRNVGPLSMLALVEAHLGDADAVRALAARAVAEHGELTGSEGYELYLRAALGLLELSIGNEQEADHHLSVVLRMLAAERIREPGVFRVHGNAAEAAVGVGELERAEEIAASLAAHAARTGHRWSRAVSWRIRALVAASRGELELARDHVQAALADHERLPMPFERARTLVVAGVVERRARRRAQARALLEEAAAEFERMGARLWAERARSELARVSGRRAGGDVLTPSERRVAELAAEGLSNKEIAQALFVTVHTVERHLSHVYDKLGVHSRAQLAPRLTPVE